MMEELYNILIVDDNPEFVKSFESLILDVAGSKIASLQHAYNGADGLVMMRDNNFHFVFMDINMPSLDGITATNFASYEFNKPEMKIIGISFHAEDKYRLQMIKAGATKYLSKDEIDAESITEIFNIDNKS